MLLRDNVYENLRSDILTCHFAPGDAMREQDLAERYAVSRQPVREALLRLEREHLVTVTPRQGYRVNPISLADARDLLRFRFALEPACVMDAIVLGNGYGGFVALQMAIRHPKIATKLVLADCGAAFSEPGREAFRNMATASMAKGLSAITDVAMRRLFAPEFQAAHPDLMQDRREAFLRTDPKVFRAACDALAALDLRPELGKVRVPALVLVGEHDEATPPPMSHELAAGLPHAYLEIIPGCAHVPQLQSPRLFLDVIADFLPVTNAAPA